MARQRSQLLEVVVTSGEPCSFQLAAVTPLVGAVVSGLDLREPLEEQTVGELLQALAIWKVLFFRRQQIDQHHHIRFATQLGDPVASHPSAPPADNPIVFHLDSANFGRADHWHTDLTFLEHPPSVSVLRPLVIPDVGGDTLWANTELAYDLLPEPLRRLAEDLRVVHTNAYDYGSQFDARKSGATSANHQRMTGVSFETIHPMVRVHPTTQRSGLLLGGYARHIDTLPTGIATDLIGMFQSYVVRPEHVVRWHWQAGDLAVWDNRGSQHFAINDYGDSRRVVERVAVHPERPIALDDFTSIVVSGDDDAWRHPQRASRGG